MNHLSTSGRKSFYFFKGSGYPPSPTAGTSRSTRPPPCFSLRPRSFGRAWAIARSNQLFSLPAQPHFKRRSAKTAKRQRPQTLQPPRRREGGKRPTCNTPPLARQGHQGRTNSCRAQTQSPSRRPTRPHSSRLFPPPRGKKGAIALPQSNRTPKHKKARGRAETPFSPSSAHRPAKTRSPPWRPNPFPSASHFSHLQSDAAALGAGGRPAPCRPAPFPPCFCNFPPLEQPFPKPSWWTFRPPLQPLREIKRRRGPRPTSPAKRPRRQGKKRAPPPWAGSS